MCGAWSRNLLEQPKGGKALGQEQHGVFRGQQGKGWRPEFNQATVHSARQTERELDSEGTKESLVISEQRNNKAMGILF